MFDDLNILCKSNYGLTRLFSKLNNIGNLRPISFVSWYRDIFNFIFSQIRNLHRFDNQACDITKGLPGSILSDIFNNLDDVIPNQKITKENNRPEYKDVSRLFH